MGIVERWAEMSLGDVGLEYVLFIVRHLAGLYLIGCVFFFVERLRPASPEQKFVKKDFKNELCYPLLNAVVGPALITFLSVVLVTWALEPYVPQHVFAEVVVAQPFVVQVLIALLVTDIGIYLEHRFVHRYLWNYHALHHMTPEVSWLTHARVHPINVVTGNIVGIVLRFVLGFEGEAAIAAAWTVAAISIWEHANLDFAWPKPFSYLLVSPRYHRWHHARDAAAIDKNFCLVFPFLDLLMGTHYCPDRMPTAYGVHRADEAEPQIPDTFAGQIMYPFRRTLESFRTVVGRSRGSSPSPSPDAETSAP